MTMMKLARMMEALEGKTPTQQVALVSKEVSKFSNRPILFSILGLEYASNNIGLAKAKKWIAKCLNIFDDEVESMHSALSDLGDTIYHLDTSKDNEQQIPLSSVYRLLELDCSNMGSSSFSLIEDTIGLMSALERKWFIRYWLKVPRNGINAGVVYKMLAKTYSKKLEHVKGHINCNSIQDTVRYYDMNEVPSTTLEHGRFVKPMLAKEVPMDKWPKEKIVDYKYDGNRYQIHKEGDSVIIFNRKGNIVTPQFQDVVERVREYPVNRCILDGEIYPIKEDGSPDEHKKMATRVHSKDHEKAREKVKVKWVIFDCLKYRIITLMDMPYSHRLTMMKELPDQAHRMKEGGDVLAFYNRAINDGFEGIIVKDANSPYQSGKRASAWAKYKPPRIELDVVILSARYGEGARANVFASFDIGVKSDNGFMPLGAIGTGFSQQDLLSLTNSLRKNVEAYDNRTYKFLPKVVLEVTADLISRDAKGNIGLRFPRVVRIRDDKYVADINTAANVIEMMV